MRRRWWEKTFSGKVWPESCKETWPGRQGRCWQKRNLCIPSCKGEDGQAPSPQALWAEQSLWSRDLSSHTQTHPQNSHTVGLTFCCYHLEIHNTFFWQVALHFYFALGPADRVASPACRASEKRNFTWSCWAKRPHGKAEGPPRCRSDESKYHRARRWRLEVPASPSSSLMRRLSRQTQTGVGEGSEVANQPHYLPLQVC